MLDSLAVEAELDPVDFPATIDRGHGTIPSGVRARLGAGSVSNGYILATFFEPGRGQMKNRNRHKCLFLLDLSSNSGGRIRTYDLRVMSPTSYQAALPRSRLGA